MGNHNKLGKSKISYKTSINVFAISFFLLVGLSLFLSGIGILNLGIWGLLWRYWPIFILMAVVQIFFSRSRLASIINASVGFGLILALITFSTAQIAPEFKKKVFNLIPIVQIQKKLPTYTGEKQVKRAIVSDSDYPQVKARIFKLDFGAGTFDLKDTNSTNHFDITSFFYENYGRPNLNIQRLDNDLVIVFDTQREVAPLLSGAEDIKYKGEFGNPEILTNLDIKVGAGTFNSEFVNLKINSLKLDVGAGKAFVELGEKALPSDKLDISVGAGSINLILPFKAFTKFNYTVGVGDLFIDGQNFKRNGSYTTSNFSIVEEPLEVNINVGAGAIFINTSGQK